MAYTYYMAETTKQKKKAFLEALENSRGVVSAVCEMTKIGRATYYHWLKTDSIFKARVDEIQRSKLEMLEDRMFVKAMGGDLKAGIYMHKHLYQKYNKQVKDEKKNEYHIYHHVGKREEPKKEPTFTDKIWEEGKRRYDLAHAIDHVDEEES